MKKQKNTEKQEKPLELPDGLKVLLGTFNKKNPDIELRVKRIKKA